MWIIRLALNRPYTFMVAALLILVLGVVSIRRTAALVHEQYSSGLVTYLQVVSADRDVLTAESAALQVLGQRLMQTIYLVKATGGGWQP